MTGDDKAEIEAKTQALGEVSQKLAEHIQQQAGPDAAAAGQAGGEEQPKQEDNVVDAEFEEVKEDDKEAKK